MTRYLYSNTGGAIGYMDNSDKYLYSQDGGQYIAYWDQQHKYMYTPNGEVYGYLAPDSQYLYSQSGEVVGYFHPKYEKRNSRAAFLTAAVTWGRHGQTIFRGRFNLSLEVCGHGAVPSGAIPCSAHTSPLEQHHRLDSGRLVSVSR